MIFVEIVICQSWRRILIENIELTLNYWLKQKLLTKLSWNIQDNRSIYALNWHERWPKIVLHYRTKAKISPMSLLPLMLKWARRCSLHYSLALNIILWLASNHVRQYILNIRYFQGKLSSWCVSFVFDWWKYYGIYRSIGNVQEHWTLL